MKQKLIKRDSAKNQFGPNKELVRFNGSDDSTRTALSHLISAREGDKKDKCLQCTNNMVHNSFLVRHLILPLLVTAIRKNLPQTVSYISLSILYLLFPALKLMLWVDTG